VAPILKVHCPELRYSAAVIGSGSEVLGFDTAMSSDHDWGPRMMLFVSSEDYILCRDSLSEKFSRQLPRHFQGFSTNFARSLENGVQFLDESESGAITHRIEIHTIDAYLKDYLGLEVSGGCSRDQAVSSLDWLTFPEQKLCAFTRGRVFFDDLGLEDWRNLFAYYPHDVWLYLLVCCWSDIEQNEHLMGRAGLVGDEIGSALIASALVRDLMRLSFLMAKTYAPYPKWFGTAFGRLPQAHTLSPLLLKVLQAPNWQTREDNLTQAYQLIARAHNQLGLGPSLPVEVRPFYDRPFKVISMGAFSQALRAMINDSELSKLAAKPLLGGVDQWSQSTDLLANPCWRPGILGLYKTV